MYSFIKRFGDLILAFIILLILSPVLIVLIGILGVTNHWTPFFVQPRLGKDQRIFKMVKFKTMNDQTDDQGKLLPDDQRLTRVGKFVRTTSLDELPQLINVLKGEMSLVGPRPLLVKYLERYSSEQRRRHEVKPGITGWAQVNGRNNISWKKRFEYDIFYVDHLSFILDLKIIYLTILKVLKREGISSKTSTTMEEFKGN